MNINEIRTPAYVLDERKLISNLEILADVQERAGCRILLAQKAFSMFAVYPMIGKYLAGTTASGLYEARLGHEEMGGETHVFAPAFKEAEIEELAEICDHIVFNSVSQLLKWRDRVRGRAGIGLRVNPECSTQDHAIYDPCAPGSRLGVTRDVLDAACGEVLDAACGEVQNAAGDPGPEEAGDALPGCGMVQRNDAAAVAGPEEAGSGCGFCGEAVNADAGSEGLAQLRHMLEGVEGLHFHTLCEQNADDLERTLAVLEEKFGDILYGMKWLNMGGGHHITRKDYDRERLIRLIRHVQETYGVEVYLEPGEAVALDAGYLVTEVMDVVENAGIRTLILDASAACHMPDVLEMPYRPRVLYTAGAESVGRQNEVAERRDDAVGEQNNIADSRNDAAGGQNNIADRRNDAAGGQNNIADSRDDAAGGQNNIADRRNDAAGGQNDVADNRNEAVGVQKDNAADVAAAHDADCQASFSGLPPVKRAGEPQEKAFTYRLSSCTCLAGDIIGDYSFDREIFPGDRLYFEDMAIYSMVKNNTFNGMCLPDIAVLDVDGVCRVQKSFGYEDFKMRLS